MLIVAPDFARRIDLPGAGPCPRPVDIDRAQTGFATLVSLRVYSFAKDMVIDGEAEDDEVFIVLMRGRIDVAVERAGSPVGDFTLRTDGGARVVFLPPHAAYHLTAIEDCDVAYARARPTGARDPAARDFAPAGDELAIDRHATGMTLRLAAQTGSANDAADGALAERFVHVRADIGAAVRVGGERIADWETVLLNPGEQAAIGIEGGTAEVLIVGAAGP